MAHSPAEEGAVHPIGRALAGHAPDGWRRIDAVFAMTVGRELGTIVYSVGERTISVPASEAVLTVVRELRAIAARAASGPWWRMIVAVAESGAPEIEYDYGELPFPPGQLFSPDCYRADLSAYRRDRLPVWLAAYVGHGDRQVRTPRQAAAQARADRSDQVWATLAENEFPALATMWARWATIAAAFVATGSRWGPRMAPWTAVFEGAGRSGSTLHVLPAGRAVLSGGVWDDPTLDAAYNGGGILPELYAGAPDWVTDVVLNTRAATGLLTFCYWWDAGRWYRGRSPGARDCATAVPGIWTATSVARIVTGLSTHGDENAVADLITVAETGRVTRDLLERAFGSPGTEIDEALHQFDSAGLLSRAPQPIPAAEALSRVRDYLAGHNLDTTGYPPERLTADRFGVGWMVYVPVAAEELVAGRAIFYVTDDGALEHSSSSIAPPIRIAELERRFADRYGVVLDHPGTEGTHGGTLGT